MSWRLCLLIGVIASYRIREAADSQRRRRLPDSAPGWSPGPQRRRWGRRV